ncbi:MAG: hypothetical protein ABF264_04750 [Flavobacteriales bacterium]
MKTVGVYFHLHESYLDKAALDLDGIESYIQNENTFTVHADGYRPNIKLQVSETDFETALLILQKLREEEE